MGQQLRLVEMPIGARDHMDHAFALHGIHRGAKAVLMEAQLSHHADRDEPSIVIATR
jgi:hypothetical protein